MPSCSDPEPKVTQKSYTAREDTSSASGATKAEHGSSNPSHRGFKSCGLTGWLRVVAADYVKLLHGSGHIFQMKGLAFIFV